MFELALTRCFEVPVLRGDAALTLTKAIVRTNQGGAAVFGTGPRDSVIVTHGLAFRTS